MNIPLIESRQLSRKEVELIAFSTDQSFPEARCKHYRHILRAADKMLTGKDPVFPGQKFPPYRIQFVLFADGLKIWID